METQKTTAEISSDRKNIICRTPEGDVAWVRPGPSASDWVRLGKHNVTGLSDGKFQYFDKVANDVIRAVFTPENRVEFVITYDVRTAEIIGINDAR